MFLPSDERTLAEEYENKASKRASCRKWPSGHLTVEHDYATLVCAISVAPNTGAFERVDALITRFLLSVS